jgi:hypothetical protein
MEKKAPLSFDHYKMIPSAENPLQSYKMPERVYKLLRPDGIVARVYRNHDSTKMFDVVLVSARAHESFHDPRVCFSGQGWLLNSFETKDVPTKTRGTIPVTFVRMSSSYEKNKIAAYFYKGPMGVYSNLQRFKLSLLWKQLFTNQGVEGVFYRFIPVYPNPTEKQLEEFVKEYVDAAYVSSKGFF